MRLPQVQDGKVSICWLNHVCWSVCVFFLFFILFVAVANVNSYFVRFLGCEDHENYFTNTQRQRIVSTHSKCFLMTGKIKNMLILIFVLYFGF